MSTPGEYIGGGKACSYRQGIDGDFHIASSYDNTIRVSFRGKETSVWWDLSLSAPDDKPTMPGVYLGAQRNSFNQQGHPGLSFSGSGRGHNTLVGEFEILELTYNDEGEIESFAANFIQGSKKRLFGSVRYNSLVPIEYGFLKQPIRLD